MSNYRLPLVSCYAIVIVSVIKNVMIILCNSMSAAHIEPSRLQSSKQHTEKLIRLLLVQHMLMPKLATQQLAVNAYHMTATGHSSSWQYNVISYNSAAVSHAAAGSTEPM